MNRKSSTFRAAAAAATLALGLVMMPTTANAMSIGGGAPSGQASQGSAQTAGLLDWFFCTRHKKPSPC